MRFTVKEGWTPLVPALLDCQNERPERALIPPFAPQDAVPVPGDDFNFGDVSMKIVLPAYEHPPALHDRREYREAREARIKLNLAAATTGDVLFLVCRLEEARAEQALIVARMDSNCAVAAAIDVEAWLSARRAPVNDWIGAKDRPYFPPI
jgi:hypothetical protein